MSHRGQAQANSTSMPQNQNVNKAEELTTYKSIMGHSHWQSSYAKMSAISQCHIAFLTCLGQVTEISRVYIGKGWRNNAGNNDA